MAFAGTYIIKTHGFQYRADSTVSQETSPNDVDSLENSQPQSGSNEYTESDYPGILDTELTSLTILQKNIFIVTLIILCVLSIFGNLCTLVVNFRRKIRPFFRACLISLAFSDLMNTVFITTAYLSQFTAEYVQIWRLGSLMCGLVPFATTAAILASSMTLVGIAVDRYYAVMKAVMGFWNPSITTCIVCMIFIWLASIGISSPVFTIYDIQPVYILTEETIKNVTGDSTTTTTTMMTTTLTDSDSVGDWIIRPPNSAADAAASIEEGQQAEGQTSWQIDASMEDLSYILVHEDELVNMCISDQKNVTLYYVIVFVIIFIPCIGAFFWFNTIIARKLWKRRHSAAISKRKTIKTVKTKTKPKSIYTPNNAIEMQTTGQVPQTQQPTSETQETRNCNCRSGHSTSTTMPSSLANSLGGGNLTTTAAATGSTSTTITTSVSTNSSREARHLRMFTIILLMMAVFVFLRLPAWIFLLMRMYGSYSKPIHWILYFVFGIMNLASSVLNPLFYTFLTETIQYVLRCKAKIATIVCGKCFSYCCSQSGRYGSNKKTANSGTSTQVPQNYGGCNATQGPVKEPLPTISCCENFCGCSGFMRATWQCYQSEGGEHQEQIHPGDQSLQQDNEMCSKDSGQILNNDKDEGVDCSDEVFDEDVRDFYDYNERIYTIFPHSIVSSSINSQ